MDPTLKAPTVHGLDVGIVGSGFIANLHATAWRKLGAKCYVYSTAVDAQGFADRRGCVITTDLRELFERVQVVDVCTPTDTHRDIVIAAATAGRDVICEKPLARTANDADLMRTTCHHHGTLLLPAHVVRFFPEYVAAKRAVDAGRIGTPAVLRLNRRTSKPVGDWFFERGRSGGVLMDQMIHDFDIARWIAGDVRTVYARLLERDGGFATGIATLTHSSGAISLVQGGWGPPGTAFVTSFSISGSHGRVEYPRPAQTALTIDRPIERGDGLLPDDDAALTPFVEQLAEFADAVLRRTTSTRVESRDGVIAVAIGEAALQSVESGLAVVVQEIL
jgi:predicted dehydrogenase